MSFISNTPRILRGVKSNRHESMNDVGVSRLYVRTMFGNQTQT